MRAHRLLAGFVLASILTGFAPSSLPAAEPRRTATVELVERVKGAVVNIHSERSVAQLQKPEELLILAPSQNRVNGMGTGIIIDPRGYILTNQHVVEEVSSLRVRLVDGSTSSARVLGRDHENDLALLKIDVNRPLPVMPLGTATDLMLGEDVIAIGNAYGYDHTVTRGIVSHTKRDVTLNKDISYKALIQTDAAINPGNSGGPLINMQGDLIGVNVAIRAGAQGIGFAIPVDTAIRVATELMANRRRTPLWHGIVAKNQVSEPEADDQTRSKPLKRSLLVERVEPGSPAARANVQPGDLLLQVGDDKVTNTLELERAVLDNNPGDKVIVTVRRQLGEQKIELALVAPEKTAGNPGDIVWRKLGVKLSGVAADAVARSNPQLHGGMVVVEMKGDGLAAKSGIQKGDIIVGLHTWEMLTLENIAFVLTHPELGTFQPVKFYIVRAGQVHRGWIQQISE